jgi:hypothetical protein
LDEIASDAVQILPQVAMGFLKSVALLLRGVIENAARHIYYTDHPVEFDRANTGRRWFVPTTDLFEYLNEHPVFAATERRFAAISQLRNVYDQLSADVHGRTVAHLQMRRALSSFRFDGTVFRSHLRRIEQGVEAVNFLLLIFHQQRVRSFPVESRRTILTTLRSEARRIFIGLR